MTVSKQKPLAASHPKTPGKDGPRRNRSVTFLALAGAVLAILGLVFLCTGGCRDKINPLYGQRTGAAFDSVNGTSVLGQMFEQAGHTVFSWRMLSPRLRRRADCIIWFPDDFMPPSQKACRWLESWLRESPGRTLIYVGRDFDASVWYWDEIRPHAPDDQRQEILRRKLEAQGYFAQNLIPPGTTEECNWFKVKGGRKHRKVRTLQGDAEWLQGVDPAQVQIELNHRIVPSPGAEVVLESKGDVLVTSEPLDGSRLIVVANGSFLLNLPLVNREHRRLAGQLIEEIGPPGQTVVFLESGPRGIFLFETDPTSGPPSGLAIFQVWPANWILLHLAVVGIILCFSRFPIFGRPRDPEPEGVSDFGRHVQALGELLQQSGDTAHAAARLSHYRQLTRPDSAARPDSARASGKQRRKAKTENAAN
jgi:hypothetical protein